jgi:indole-3-glycerol phosphate synthase
LDTLLEVSVLDEIINSKLDEVAALRALEAALLEAARAAPAPRDFGAALRRPDGTVAVIAEFKRRSPSKGALAPDLDPVATAIAYEAGGAAALSVLTDAPYFDGSLADLEATRDACRIPVLRKDFTIDPLQILEARGAGADAVLLIVAAIPDDVLLADLHSVALEWGLSVLVEAHSDGEIDRALSAGARIVGVNSRDLSTFSEDLGVAQQLATRIPPDVLRVAESAIRTTEDVARMAEAGFDAVLVGEALVRSADPSALVREMTSATVARP